jgi:hypothetical protein
MAFLDAAATCLILVQHDPPINPMLDDQTLGLWGSRDELRRQPILRID